jgi:hypothetical protein
VIDEVGDVRHPSGLVKLALKRIGLDVGGHPNGTGIDEVTLVSN